MSALLDGLQAHAQRLDGMPLARLLLAGARPETILCVTYTKAAAAEMQRTIATIWPS